jgi:hypothetical protein
MKETLEPDKEKKMKENRSLQCDLKRCGSAGKVEIGKEPENLRT